MTVNCLVFIDATEPELRLGDGAETLVCYPDGTVVVQGLGTAITATPGGFISGTSTVTKLDFRFETPDSYIIAAHNQGVPIRSATFLEKVEYKFYGHEYEPQIRRIIRFIKTRTSSAN